MLLHRASYPHISRVYLPCRQANEQDAKRMNTANNWALFVRENHDNPTYFGGKTFKHKRFMAIPDYSIVIAYGHTLLYIGRAISIGPLIQTRRTGTNPKEMLSAESGYG